MKKVAGVFTDHLHGKILPLNLLSSLSPPSLPLPSLILSTLSPLSISLSSLFPHSSDDRSFTSDDIPLMTVGRHSHDRFGGVAPSTLDTWIPILSHKLFKTLGRRIVYHTSSRYSVT